MTRQEAIKILERLQEPEAWEPQISHDAYTALQMAIDALGKDTNVPINDCISRRAAIDAIEKKAYRHTYLDQIIDIVSGLPSAQPEPEIYWGYTPTYERPLADDEIVPRLRDIDALLGGSYAIHRAIEIIEAVAERRTDEPEK